MGNCCATPNKPDAKEKRKPEVRNKDEFIIEKADFIGLNKSKFKDCYTLGKILGNGALGEVRTCKSKSVN